MENPLPIYGWNKEDLERGKKLLAERFGITELPDEPDAVLYNAICAKLDGGRYVQWDESIERGRELALIEEAAARGEEIVF